MPFAWEIPSLADQDEYVTTCYYGETGAGKTTAAVAGLSRLGPTLVIDAEGGLKRRALAQRGTVLDNVSVLPKPGTRITYGWLDKLYFKLSEALEKDPHGLTGIVWDTGSQIAQLLLEETSAENTERAARASKPRSPFQTELQDHGMNTDKLRSLLRRYRNLPCHFVMTAQERRDQDDDGKVRYGPAFPPATQQAVKELADVIVHMDPSEVQFDKRKRPVGPVVYKALCGTGTKYIAKDRFSLLPRHLVDPDFDRILAYVTGELTADADPVQGALQGEQPEDTPEDTEPTPEGGGTNKER